MNKSSCKEEWGYTRQEGSRRVLGRNYKGK